MKIYYVTFGTAHDHDGTYMADKYVVVHAMDEWAARAMVVEKYGRRWAFIYEEDEFAGSITKHNLRRHEVLK
jgi:thioredoxin reductase